MQAEMVDVYTKIIAACLLLYLIVINKRTVAEMLFQGVR
jgi:uncharacterized integral membrane protein